MLNDAMPVSPTCRVRVLGVPDERFLCLFGAVVDSCLLLERKRGLLQKCRELESLAKRKLWFPVYETSRTYMNVSNLIGIPEYLSLVLYPVVDTIN